VKKNSIALPSLFERIKALEGLIFITNIKIAVKELVNEVKKFAILNSIKSFKMCMWIWHVSSGSLSKLSHAARMGAFFYGHTWWKCSESWL